MTYKEVCKKLNIIPSVLKYKMKSHFPNKDIFENWTDEEVEHIKRTMTGKRGKPHKTSDFLTELKQKIISDLQKEHMKVKQMAKMYQVGYAEINRIVDELTYCTCIAEDDNGALFMPKYC